MTIHSLSPDDLAAHLDGFCRILIDTVADGAAVGFLHPVQPAQAKRFWCDEVGPELAANRRALFGAFDGSAVVGTVQLITALPPNQPHRAEIAKLMVHPDARRKGLGRALIAQAIACAREAGKTLITLDTRTGDAAQPLYASVGFQKAGVIPDFGVDPDGQRLHATTYMYKHL